MISKGTNAKAQTNRKSNQSHSSGRQGGLGELPGNSTNGLQTESVRVDQEDCVGGHPYWQCPHCGHENDDFGKILERLDKLEKKHLEYVDAHQGRLRARLNESESSKDEFLQEAGDLRGDIYALITTPKHCNNCNDI